MGINLQIKINIDDKITDMQIEIACNTLTPELERVLATLRMMDKKLVVKNEGETFLLDVEKAIYIESIDKKTFIYTTEDVYESALRLYELEQQLSECGFFRASKSCLIQIKHIRSLKSLVDRKICVTLENGEQVMVSRQYADELKRKLHLL